MWHSVSPETAYEPGWNGPQAVWLNRGSALVLQRVPPG
jgi:hypothetical protein